MIENGGKCGQLQAEKNVLRLFDGGHHDCAWKVAGQHLKSSQSFAHLAMLFHEAKIARMLFRAGSACLSQRRSPSSPQSGHA